MKLQALAAATALAAVVGAVQAGDTPSVDAAQALRVTRDKDTGELRKATAEEAKALAEAEKALRAGQPERALVVRQHANGMRSARLSSEYLSSLQAVRQPDGSLKVMHDKAGDEHAHDAPQQLPTK
jgi:hypothetical protein